MTNLPRIDTVSIPAPMTVRIKWRGKRAVNDIILAGWIATGGDVLSRLHDPIAFAQARVENYGAAVAWEDLAIDAEHLRLLSEEQAPFEADAARAWQASLDLSNNEAADLLGVSLSTWNAYKAAQANIPRSIAMLCRAAQRDPVVMQAHYRPRTAGRPARAR